MKINTTILLYAHRAISQTGKATTDLVEFYADASPPCCKTEFKKNSRLILQCTCGKWFALGVVTLKEMATRMRSTWTAHISRLEESRLCR